MTTTWCQPGFAAVRVTQRCTSTSAGGVRLRVESLGFGVGRVEALGCRV